MTRLSGKDYPPRWPRVVAWLGGALASIAVLAGLGYVIGRERPARSDRVVESWLEALSTPGVAAVTALAALLGIAWCVSHLRLEWLAWLPGRIVVPDFARTGDIAESEIGEATLRFRGVLARGLAGLTLDPADQLGQVRLELSGDGAPGAEGYFLDVFGKGEVEGGGLLGNVLSFARAASPNHAYELKGALARRDRVPRHGVAVQVVRLPGQASAPVSVWACTLEEALAIAAHHAIALILPRTRLCRAHWTAWRRRVMPADLLHSYESARELELERGYDEALGYYYRALEKDPSNPGLRMHVARLEEKLGLSLDALASYEDLIALRLPRSPLSRLRFPASRARRESERALATAMYRRALLLAQPALAGQWRLGPPRDLTESTERDRRRERLRERLRPAIWTLCLSALERKPRRGRRGRRPDPPRLGRTQPQQLLGFGAASEELTFLELQELFQLTALDQLTALRSRRWVRAGSHTHAATGLSELATFQRLGMTQGAFGGERETSFEAGEISRQVSRIEPRRGFRTWEQHYNAAVVYALPLLHPSHDLPRDEQLAIGAVEHLERCVSSTDAAVVETQRDWILSEDPDLDGLRPHAAFRRFETRYFPSSADAPPRPRDVARWEAARYAQEVLVETAHRWQATWEGRVDAVDADTPPSTLKTWLEDESRAWRLVRRYLLNYRDWRVRLELIVAMHAWAQTYGFPHVLVRFPRWAEAMGPQSTPAEATPHETPLEAVDNLDLRFALFRHRLCDPRQRAPELAVLAGEAASALGGLDGWHGLPPGSRALLCEGQAAVWQALTHLAMDPDRLSDRVRWSVAHAQETLNRFLQQLREAKLSHKRGDQRDSSSEA